MADKSFAAAGVVAVILSIASPVARAKYQVTADLPMVALTYAQLQGILKSAERQAGVPADTKLRTITLKAGTEELTLTSLDELTVPHGTRFEEISDLSYSFNRIGMEPSLASMDLRLGDAERHRTLTLSGDDEQLIKAILSNVKGQLEAHRRYVAGPAVRGGMAGVLFFALSWLFVGSQKFWKHALFVIVGSCIAGQATTFADIGILSGAVLSQAPPRWFGGHLELIVGLVATPIFASAWRWWKKYRDRRKVIDAPPPKPVPSGPPR